MSIEDYIKELDKRNIISNTTAMKKWWCDEIIKNGSWVNMGVNFFTLLADVPLYEFNDLYTKWYKVYDGSMGDFLEANPTDKQIIDFIDGKGLTF